MRKILHLLLVVSVLLLPCALLLCACDTPTPPDQTSGSTPSDSSASAEKPAPIEPVKAVGLKYTVNADRKSCTVTGIGKCKDPHIVIEEHIDGYRVTAIGPSAFKNCDFLLSVSLPDSVVSIGKSAFENCDALTDVNIPEGVVSIGTRAFKGCESITQITIPQSVTAIEKDIFYKASNLETVYFFFHFLRNSCSLIKTNCLFV